MKDRGHTPLLRTLAGRVLYWAPVWLSLLICVQLTLRGLRPALREEERLDREERDMALRFERLEAERQRLLEGFAKLDDPIYRERVHRSLRVAGGEPLTLERVHVGTLFER